MWRGTQTEVGPQSSALPLPGARAWEHNPAMAFPTLTDHVGHHLSHVRQPPDRETLMLATAGATEVLGTFPTA